MRRLLLNNFLDSHCQSRPAKAKVNEQFIDDVHIEFTDKRGGGKAVYENPNHFKICKIEYEEFIDSLSHD